MGARIANDNRGACVLKAGELLEKEIRAVAFTIEGEAKRRAPVDTGNLRASIHATKIIDKPRAWEVRASANYALFVEMGTRFTRAQPFFAPAIQKGLEVISMLASRRAGGN